MSQPLRWAQFIAVLGPGWLEADLEQGCDADLGRGVRLTTTPPSWIREAPSRWNLGREERGILELALPALVVDLKENGEAWRGSGLGPQYEPPVERIWHTNLALWLARPCAVHVALYLHFEEATRGDAYFDAQLTRRSRLRAHGSYQDARLSVGDLRRAASLNEALAAVDDNTSIMNAARALFSALCESSSALRYLLLWMALEALFGPSEAMETTHRLRQRMALFLRDGEEAYRLFKEAAGAYSMRSKIVHGRGRGSPQLERQSGVVELWAQESLARILLDSQHIRVFGDDTLREEYLNKLAFR